MLAAGLMAGEGSRRGWIVGGVITAEAEGGYFLPACRERPDAQRLKALSALGIPGVARGRPLGVGCQG